MRRLKHDSQCQATGYKADVHSICWSFPTSAMASVSSFLAGDAHKNHLCPNSRLIFWIFCNKLGPSRLSFSALHLWFSLSLYTLSCSEKRASPHFLLLLRLLFASRILFYWLPPLCLKKNPDIHHSSPAWKHPYPWAVALLLHGYFLLLPPQHSCRSVISHSNPARWPLCHLNSERKDSLLINDIPVCIRWCNEDRNEFKLINDKGSQRCQFTSS